MHQTVKSIDTKEVLYHYQQFSSLMCKNIYVRIIIPDYYWQNITVLISSKLHSKAINTPFCALIVNSSDKKQKPCAVCSVVAMLQ